MTFAKAGEIITCENGHPVYELRSDLARYGAVRADAFKGLGENKDPVGGEPIKGTCSCGAAFIRHHNRWQAHFADGWRPPEDATK